MDWEDPERRVELFFVEMERDFDKLCSGSRRREEQLERFLFKNKIPNAAETKNSEVKV